MSFITGLKRVKWLSISIIVVTVIFQICASGVFCVLTVHEPGKRNIQEAKLVKLQTRNNQISLEIKSPVSYIPSLATKSHLHTSNLLKPVVKQHFWVLENVPDEIAQWLEHSTCNGEVVGSYPTLGSPFSCQCPFNMSASWHLLYWGSPLQTRNNQISLRSNLLYH